ncbi:hypothetical protein ACFVS2_21075 [Brevibacillus sp. NPDC058079]|uniref:hypothetical protein n=1 Tax=Brevibacillus sp. NPDC058079 TaxID=3346330 RepID=UPI0036ECE35B
MKKSNLKGGYEGWAKAIESMSFQTPLYVRKGSEDGGRYRLLEIAENFFLNWIKKKSKNT